MQISLRQFEKALEAAALLKDVDVLREAAGSGTSRSYFVEFEGHVFPLKAILRLAYKRARLEWDGLQSAKAARELRPHFKVLHITSKGEKARLERQRKALERWARDPKFRVDVLDLYSSTCAISGCTALDAIDAAHLLGIGEAGDDIPENGIILRADLHRLFDAKPHRMSINPKSLTVHFSPDCVGHYANFEGVTVVLPRDGPQGRAFASHWKAFQRGCKRDR